MQKPGIRLMFWSGADFDEAGLNIVGRKFKDASLFFTEVSEVNEHDIRRWIRKAKDIQWDYKNMAKRKGRLERLPKVGSVLSVSRSEEHTFSKAVRSSVLLVAGLGVQGDVHSGETVKHRSRVKADTSQPNLRQIHLIHSELLDELRAKGFAVEPGDMGENITTTGIDLLGLPRDTNLQIGSSAIVRVTGLRNPCMQLDAFQEGLMRAVLERAPSGDLIRKCGIMGVVLAGGEIWPGDPIVPILPDEPHCKLERV